MTVLIIAENHSRALRGWVIDITTTLAATGPMMYTRSLSNAAPSAGWAALAAVLLVIGSGIVSPKV